MINIQVKNDLNINSEDPKKFKLKSSIKQSKETIAVVDWPIYSEIDVAELKSLGKLKLKDKLVDIV